MAPHCSRSRLAVIIAVSVLATVQVAAGEPRVIYSTDFQGTVGPEWTPNTRTGITPIGARTFLGPFGPEVVTLALNPVPHHGYVTVTFDLFIIGSWDGNYTGSGPDIWDLSAIHGLTGLHTTFNTHDFVGQYQAYPDTYPGGQHPSHTGAAEIGTLGYPCSGNCRDAVYHMNVIVDHSDSALTLNFSATNLEAIANESWGLDNVTVVIEGAAADFNHDWDVDLQDFMAFQICFNGPNQPPAMYCPVDADFDDDADVDLVDFAVFRGCFNGPNRPPACQ